ncbi:hypothetical protein MNB_ARC-1_867 [hydrothermal vent metagenome]|uniref:Uncharacterized protein n=1 Tax=hydrothermal vent metagenome TaxID=652676 RepID=A0A3B1EA01_9ZZZZ
MIERILKDKYKEIATSSLFDPINLSFCLRLPSINQMIGIKIIKKLMIALESGKKNAKINIE